MQTLWRVVVFVVLSISAVVCPMGCDGRASAPPVPPGGAGSQTGTGLPPEVEAHVARRMQAMPRLSREGNDPTVAASDEARAFVGVWYYEETDEDGLVITESQGRIRLEAPDQEEATTVYNNVRVENERLVYDTAFFWNIEPPHPFMADMNGMRMRGELALSAVDPDEMEVLEVVEGMGLEPERGILRRRPATGGG
ncbi:MAG: hypothetical protein R3B68_00350 [Phycisphaerales bacterium]